ncbi:restriction endonuclease subunit S [Candidatus Protofrankia californiensis]|uniref:restriction endonuclease subunit S n=1 Tax=Candidatus Protofrankia californiensis TaxID=1839754 RepID=UPI001041831B|nr:restriction endonuclease subunit S [Candidatus Protofrankia californiensis]
MTPLPPGWAHVRLDEIAEVRLGRQRSPKNHNGLHMRPYLRAANVGWNGLKLDDIKQMNFTDDELDTYRLLPGDIVLSEASGSPGEVGKPALWNNEIEDCCLQNTLIRVRSYGADPKFLLLLLRHEAQRGAFVEHSRGVGIHHIGVARLAGWPIMLPPLAEQRRIVVALDEYLGQVDACVDLLTKIDKKIDVFRRSIRGFTATGSEPAVGCPLPSHWRWGPLSSVVSKIEAGKSFNCQPRPADATEWGVIKVSAMTWGEFRPYENKALPPGREVDPRHEITPGDILVSRANTAEYVGAPVIVRNCRPQLLLSDKSLRLKPAPGIDREWLLQVLASTITRKQISALATGTKDSMRNISQQNLMRISIPIPPIDQQAIVARQIQDNLEQAARLEAVCSQSQVRTTSLRKSLLAEAFAGRLVEQDPGDEPAPVLLERIRTERAAAGASVPRGTGVPRGRDRARKPTSEDVLL